MVLEKKPEEEGGVVAERSEAGVTLPLPLSYYGTLGRELGV